MKKAGWIAVIISLFLAMTALAESAQPAKGESQNPSFRDQFTDGRGQAPEMVVIPKGQFMMGYSVAQNELLKTEIALIKSKANKPRSLSASSGRGIVLVGGEAKQQESPHLVTIRQSFALGRYEVTTIEYMACVQDGACHEPIPSGESLSSFKPVRKLQDDHPVVNVVWEHAQQYVRWLSNKTGKSYRLPSEAEWEYACRAGEDHLYCGGDDLDSVAWYGEKSRRTMHPVGKKKPNAWGLYDMTGNVEEWVQDCYSDSLASAPLDGSSWECPANRDHSRPKRVARGGSWSDEPRSQLSAARAAYWPDMYGRFLGFRIARSLP